MAHKLLFILLTIVLSASAIFAQSSSFTFQGKLNDGAIAANGTYQFQFKLYEAASGGSQVGQTIADIPATVTNGIFAVNLDFGEISFDGAARFIEIGVRLNGSGQPYTILNPRQSVASTPYAVKSLKSDEATTAVTANNSLNLGGILASEYVQTTDTRMSDDRNPLANSSFYIQNGTSLQTTSNFNVSGEGRASILNAVTQFNLNGVRILDGSLGSGNLFAGYDAGMNNTSLGDASAFFGVRAGQKNTDGAFNSFFGYQGGLNNTTGGFNTFLGSFAGTSNTTENNNTFIGYAANGAVGITNSAAIGAFATVTTSNTMVLGTNAVTVQVPGTLNVVEQYNLNGVRILDGSLGSGNLLTGFEAGMNNTGGGTTFVGVRAGKSNTTGIYNSFFGYQAGLSNQTTEGNSFFGTFAGMNNIASGNSFFGSFTGRDNTTGIENSYFGQAAGMQTTTGKSNSYFGNGAGYSNLTGANNTFVGTLAGLSNTTEDNNTFIGYKANGAAGITNAAAIGANSVVTTSDTMVLGTNSVTVQVPGSLNVAGTFGANVLNSATVYKINNNRVFHLTGTDNTFVGFESGNAIGTGNFNAFYGSYSGKNTTTGLNNAFFGSYAGRANITGGNNAFFGTNAGLSNKASFNSFFGSAAGSANLNGASNSFFGTLSGANSESGDNNSFFGRSAGSEVTTGSNNTFIGALSGVLNTNTAGSNNTAIGYNTKFGAGVSNSIAIGANITVTSSDSIKIGSGGMNTTFGGNVSASGLSVNGISSNSVSTNTLFSSQGEINDLTTQKITIFDDPNIPGLPDASEFFDADFKGEVRVDKLFVGNFSVGGGSFSLCYEQPVGTQYMNVKPCSSSLRFKENIQNFTGGLSVLNRLRPVTFDWKSNGTRDIGFIAEEVNAVEPLFSTFNGEGQLQGVKYAQITTVLVNSVKEQQTQIDQLQERIKQQQAQIDALKALLCSQNPTAGICAASEKK